MHEIALVSLRHSYAAASFLPSPHPPPMTHRPPRSFPKEHRTFARVAGYVEQTGGWQLLPAGTASGVVRICREGQRMQRRRAGHASGQGPAALESACLPSQSHPRPRWCRPPADIHMPFTSVEEALQFRQGPARGVRLSARGLAGSCLVWEMGCRCLGALVPASSRCWACLGCKGALPTAAHGRLLLLTFCPRCSARLRLPSHVGKDKSKTQAFVEEVRAGLAGAPRVCWCKAERTARLSRLPRHVVTGALAGTRCKSLPSAKRGRPHRGSACTL